MINKIIDLYREDLQSSDIKEFPISPMSAALSTAIHHVIEDMRIMDSPNLCGLDVGSGSGIQAAILSYCGCTEVSSIDISDQAVIAARSRFERLCHSITSLKKIEAKNPQFKLCSLLEMPIDKDKYDIIVTNPPSYFTDRSKHETPLDMGLYDGSAQYSLDPKKSFLYNFFERIVNPCLKPGGVSICTWPGIEYRLVYNTDTIHPVPVVQHPTVLLNKWFGWNLEPFAELNGQDFYVNEAPISGSCTDDFFWHEFQINHARKCCYSNFLTAGRTKTKFLPTFRYGILVLIRDENDRNLFRLKILPPKGRQGRGGG